jgi:hypothetical protein
MLMESIIAHARGGKVLNTYDFVDVIDKKARLGWQVKSTKASTPVTWKRAKIPNSEDLLIDSHKGPAGLQALGDAIIDFCNEHVQESFLTYGLQEIGYSRLVVHPNGTLTYFERELCTMAHPNIFNKVDFTWKWSNPKSTTKKEQLQALHGTNKHTGKKWWAWHGLGENQLHFSGEPAWWPPLGDPHRKDFKMPADRLDFQQFITLLEKL